MSEEIKNQEKVLTVTKSAIDKIKENGGDIKNQITAITDEKKGAAGSRKKPGAVQEKT